MKNKPGLYHNVASSMVNVDPKTLNAIHAAQDLIPKFIRDNKALLDLAKAIQPVAKKIKPLNDLFVHLREVQESIKYYIETRIKLSKKIAIFPANGWYLSSQFADLLDYAKLISFLEGEEKGWSADIEKMIVQAFEENFEEIKMEISDTFPKRGHILALIFRLHGQEDFIASIPLALTQADGICKDNFFQMIKGIKRPVGFFDIEPTKNKIRGQSIAKNIQVPESSLISFLRNQLAESDRNQHQLLEGNTTKLSDLNRHAILHGESLDYGNRINSIKAILLLDFIADLVIVNRYFVCEQKRPAS